MLFVYTCSILYYIVLCVYYSIIIICIIMYTYIYIYIYILPAVACCTGLTVNLASWAPT